jgi:hypothetical protein
VNALAAALLLAAASAAAPEGPPDVVTPEAVPEVATTEPPAPPAPAGGEDRGEGAAAVGRDPPSLSASAGEEAGSDSRADAASASGGRGEGAPVADDPDLAAARIAWRYFERNTHDTGLVSAVEGHPSTTAWDLGSSIVAALAAHELGIVAGAELDARLSALLRTLETLPLFAGELPNKAYDARTARMTDYANAPAPEGIGFSAVDLGRLVSALVLAGDLRPGARSGIERVLARWNTCRLVSGGELLGVHRDGAGHFRHLQEGRLGYEQYAGKALALLGLDTTAARSYGRFLAELPLLGVAVPHDARDRKRHGAVDALVTEPWALDGLEFGLGSGGAPLAHRVFEVQKRRWERTGIVTALSEDHLDRPPWFGYGAIVANGVPWRTVDPEGKEIPGLRSLSTKAAFALSALHPDDPYAAVLRSAVEAARDPDRGWLAGIYEDGRPNRAITANTNGVVLETLLFRRRGPLHEASALGDREAWRARVASLAGRRPCPRDGAGASRPGSTASQAPLDLAASAGHGLPGAAPPRRSHDGPRVGGSALLSYRGAEGPGAGGVATIWPWRAAFLRLGAEATPRSDRGDTRLLWGFGWDDWRPNTFSLTVHNWGPLTPGDAPGWRAAEANLGYKLFRACFEGLCIAPLAAVTVPFAGGPYADLRVSFIIGGKWFAMGGIGRTIPDVFVGPVGTPRWRIVYGFGRLDWRPGTFFLTYHDWGPDWRARNGVLAMGVNWAF